MDFRIGYTAASSIAATNAVIQHLGIGQFLSLFDTDGVSDGDSVLGPAKCYSIEGRTNTGHKLIVECAVIITSQAEYQSGTFPVTQVIVARCKKASRRKGERHEEEFEFYQCTWNAHGIHVMALPRSPH